MATTISNYKVVLHHPTGNVELTLSHDKWKAYSIPAVPEDYRSSYVSVVYQLFTDTTYSVDVTSEYSGTNKFSIYYNYYQWQLYDSSGPKFNPSNVLNLDNYTATIVADTQTAYIHLYPVIFRKYIRGTFDSTGPYSSKNITITGKCNYTGGTNTSVTSKLKRFYVPKNWTRIQNKEFGPVSPGSTQDIDIDSIDYTEGNTVYVKGVHSHTTAWATCSESKSIADLPKPTAPSNPFSYYDVTLQTTDNVDHDTETLSVAQRCTYTFDHWSTTSAGTDTVSTSLYPLVNTTVYAKWSVSKTNTTTLPKWTTADTMKYGDSAYRTFTLSCYSTGSDATPFYTKSVNEYEFKPAKHTGWKVGETVYAIGSVVSCSEGTTYTAIWEPDASGTSSYSLYDNVILCPLPDDRAGFTFVGLASSSTATVAEYTLKSRITITDDTILYGVWTADGTVHIYDSTTQEFERYRAIIYNGATGEWEMYVPKIYNGTDWNDLYT